MHVKEGLVFDKNTGNLTGFIDIDDINMHLIEYENQRQKLRRPLAKSVVVFMVRGLVSNLLFPYALFPVKSTKGSQLFTLMWNVIERLTRMDFMVMAVTCDGAKCNQKMFQMHNLKESSVYKTKNVFSCGQEIRFICDPPHLVKTARNCLASNKRNLWVRNNAQESYVHTYMTLLSFSMQCCGLDLKWDHIIQLYRRNNGNITSTPGLSLTHKLKYI